jgi:hypothetical protein
LRASANGNHTLPKPSRQSRTCCSRAAAIWARSAGTASRGSIVHSILAALAVTNENLATVEIDVLDAQSHAFHDAHPAAVQELADQAMDIVQLGEDRRDFTL